MKAASKLMKKMKFHTATYQISAKTGYTKKGRPSPDHKPVIKGYQLQSSLQEDDKAIELAKRSKGRFILSTNELNKDSLPDEQALRVQSSIWH